MKTDLRLSGMPDLSIIETITVIICLSPVWGTFIWFVWEGFLRPGLIPRHIIMRDVEKLYAYYGEQAFDYASMREHQAWYHSDDFEQGRWRRIRREIMKRERTKVYIFKRIK